MGDLGKEENVMENGYDREEEEKLIGVSDSDSVYSHRSRVSVLDFNVLCTKVANQSQGKWSLFESEEENEDEESGKGGGGVLRMWEGEVVDCFHDDRIAIESMCCPCYRFGKNMRRAGLGPCFIQGAVYFLLVLFAFLTGVAFTVTRRRCFLYLAIGFTMSVATYLGFFRTQIRRKFNIRGSDNSMDDCIYHLICPCCALCQKIASKVGISGGGSNSGSGSASAPKRRRPVENPTPRSSTGTAEDPTSEYLNRLNEVLDPNLFDFEESDPEPVQQMDDEGDDEADGDDEEGDEGNQQSQGPSEHTVQSEIPAPPVFGGSSSEGGRAVSHVWRYFDKIEVHQQGGAPSRMFKATCKLCGKNNIDRTYNCKKGGGTGTLSRHLAQQHGITKDNMSGTSSTRQTQLHGYAGDIPGGGMPFTFDRERMIYEFANYVIVEELPFSHGESEPLEYYNRVSVQPQWRCIPRNTLKRKALLQWAKQRYVLFDAFKALDARVSLTCDTWTSPIGDPFISVTAHWLDDDWCLQKRIIAFQGMDDRHNGYNIKTRIMEICHGWGISNKIFSLSLDNATANTKAVEYFIDDVNFPKILDGRLFHVRCCAHVLNLSAQEGLREVSALLDPLRDLTRWIKFRREVKEEYKELCKRKGVPPRKLKGDCPTRWNSTYDLLAPALQYKDILSQIYNSRVKEQDIITDYHWNVCEKLCNVLSVYNIATQYFSLVYEPNINQVILQALNIILAISEGLETPEISRTLKDMLRKWHKYMGQIPYIYGIAILLDPCLKDQGLENALTFYYSVVDSDYDVDKYVCECRTLLEQLYAHYVTIYCPNQPPPSEPSYASRFNPALASILFKNKGKQAASSSSTPTEIEDYYAAAFENIQVQFDILNFWKSRQNKFPILSKIARDILAVPASTIAAESSFSAGKRVIDERRTSLSPLSIELCVCKRDWDLADRRKQHMVERSQRLDTPDSGSSAGPPDSDSD